MLNAPDLLRTRGQEKDRGMVKDGEGRLSKEEKIALERVLWALEDLRTVDKTLSLHHATALLRVAISEGKSVAELVREAGVAQSVMSRHLLDLGPMDRNRNPGPKRFMTSRERAGQPSSDPARSLRNTPINFPVSDLEVRPS